MKKIQVIAFLLIILGGTEKLFSQSFSFVPIDTLKYEAPEGYIGMSGNVINNTSDTVLIDVVRVKNATSTAGGTDWTTYFCIDQCFPPTVDSVRYGLPPGNTYLIVDMETSITPDSQTVYMKIKDVATPSTTVYQMFHGITQVGFGIHEYANLANVSVYPCPVVAGNTFSMDITNLKIPDKEISLLVYDIYGSRVAILPDLRSGHNTLTLDLAAGMYSYRLISGDTSINSGTISVIH
jgi:hypothetical protein